MVQLVIASTAALAIGAAVGFLVGFLMGGLLSMPDPDTDRGWR